jgi:hypothetical protein
MLRCLPDCSNVSDSGIGLISGSSGNAAGEGGRVEKTHSSADVFYDDVSEEVALDMACASVDFL